MHQKNNMERGWMTQTPENVEVESISKFNKITLTIVAALLIFVGPTYIPSALADNFKADYVISIGLGAVLFIVGMLLLVYLVRKKVVT
jgi:hypothetical protein